MCVCVCVCHRRRKVKNIGGGQGLEYWGGGQGGGKFSAGT